VKAFPYARFEIAGDGPLREELETQVRELSLENSVTFLGFLSQTQLRQLYARAHIFLHPSEMPPDSNQEGIPNSMLEAMASGLPIVATRHGGIPEAVTDGVNGLLVSERDVSGLTDALLTIIRDADRWRSMGVSAAQTVANEFAQARQIEVLESAYLEAIELGKRELVGKVGSRK